MIRYNESEDNNNNNNTGNPDDEELLSVTMGKDGRKRIAFNKRYLMTNEDVISQIIAGAFELAMVDPTPFEVVLVDG